MDILEEKAKGESDRRRDDLNEKDESEGSRGAVETPPLFYDDRKHSGLLDA